MVSYDAFISYSSGKDRIVATALHSAMQRLGKSWYMRRGLRIFRDDASLSATPSLWPSIENALKHSRYFILLASPEAARSKWVAKEAAYWFSQRDNSTILVAITDGELVWQDDL